MNFINITLSLRFTMDRIFQSSSGGAYYPFYVLGTLSDILWVSFFSFERHSLLLCLFLSPSPSPGVLNV